MSSTDLFLFSREFLRSFQTTGAFFPSGKSLARALTQPLETIPEPRKVLEAGPGTGAVTDSLVQNLGSRDELLLCEINPVFAEHLKRRLQEDSDWKARSSQISLVREDVRECLEPEKFDLIVSGLPLNNFSPEFVKELLKLFMAALRPGGVHTFFEYQAVRRIRRLLGLPATRRNAEKLESVFRETLSHFEIARVPVFANIPPAWAYRARNR